MQRHVPSLRLEAQKFFSPPKPPPGPWMPLRRELTLSQTIGTKLLKKCVEANNSKMSFWEKYQRQRLEAQGQRAVADGLPNWLPHHPLVSLFPPFFSPSPTGKAYAPEFYYDTYNPLWQNRPRVYSYSLQWTQMNPDAVDRILAYRLGIRQVRKEIRLCRRAF